MKYTITTLILALTALLPANESVIIGKNSPFRGAPVISTITLPKPSINLAFPFEQLLMERGEKPELSSESLKIDRLSQILWAGYGIANAQNLTRTVDSIDNGYSILLYVITTNSVYVYVPNDHSLAKIMDSDIRTRLAAAANRDKNAYISGTTIVIAGSPRMAGHKQPREGRFFMQFEAGKVAQNMEIAGITQNVGFILNEKLDRSKISALLRMPSGFEPVCLMVAGRLIEPIKPLTQPQQQTQPNIQLPTIQPAQEQQITITLPRDETKTDSPAQIESQEKRKKVLIYLSDSSFQEQPFTEITELIEILDIDVDVTATTLESIRGDLGGRISADLLVSDAWIDNYEAVIIIGGLLSSRSSKQSDAIHNLVQEAFAKNKIIAAYGRGVSILTDSGILSNGITVTGSASLRRTVSKAGGNYINEPVVVDGKIITAKDSKDTAASSIDDGLAGNVGFAKEVVKMLKKTTQTKAVD